MCSVYAVLSIRAQLPRLRHTKDSCERSVRIRSFSWGRRMRSDSAVVISYIFCMTLQLFDPINLEYALFANM